MSRQWSYKKLLNRSDGFFKRKLEPMVSLNLRRTRRPRKTVALGNKQINRVKTFLSEESSRF